MSGRNGVHFRPAKSDHGLDFIASQSEIEDVKVVPHVSAVCCASERQHPELDSETKYYLRNRLIVVRAISATRGLRRTW